MADSPTKKDIAPIEADSAGDSPKTNTAAQVTVKIDPPADPKPVTTPVADAADSLINQPTAPSSPKVAEKSAESKDPAPPADKPTGTDTQVNATQAAAKPEAKPAMDEKPVIVTDNEVKVDADEHDRLSDEVEILTGEVQALEAKIDRLTTDVVELPETNARETKDKADEKPVEPPKPAELTPPVVPLEARPPKVDESKIIAHPAKKPAATSSVSDIYPKLDDKKIPPTTDSKPLNDATDEENESALGMIGEVMGIIGIILLVLMMLSPFYKEIIGSNAWSIVKAVGWITALIAIGIGFLLSLFNRGKWALKAFLFVFLLLAALMYFGVNGNATITAQLDSYFGTILGFYR